jgi:signal transduction histidine kinase
MRLYRSVRTVSAVSELVHSAALVRLAEVPRRVPRVDVVIAGGLVAWALLEAFFAEGPGSVPARVAFAVGYAAPLVVRRRWPIQVLLTIVGLAVVRGVLWDEPEAGAMPFPSLIVATFSAALYARPAWLAVAAAPLPMVAFVFGNFAGSPTAVDLAIISFITLGAWTGGWIVRRRAEQVVAAQAAGPELARQAVASERTRLARELHDVVAHSVTIISLQAGAAEAVLDGDPVQARVHLEAVRKTAHEALVELRRLVGVLREAEPVYEPQGGLGRLDELIDEMRAAGLAIELREEGARPALPPGVDLSAYRIVQESLTNVRRHAGTAPTRVRLRYCKDALELEVENSCGSGKGALGPGTGHGLIGMRERARLYGGTLDARATPDGGFVVRARLPLEAMPQ